ASKVVPDQRRADRVAIGVSLGDHTAALAARFAAGPPPAAAAAPLEAWNESACTYHLVRACRSRCAPAHRRHHVDRLASRARAARSRRDITDVRAKRGAYGTRQVPRRRAGPLLPLPLGT